MTAPPRARFQRSTVAVKRPRPGLRFVGTDPAVTKIGSASSIISSSTVSATIGSGGAKVGTYVVAVVSGDNNGASGASSLTGVTDGPGNTYTLVGSQVTYSPGSAAADGVTVAIYLAPVTAAITGGNTVTANWSPNTTSKCLTVFRVPRLTGRAIGFASATGTGTSTDVTAARPVPARSIIVAVVAAESNSGNGTDADTDGDVAWVSQDNIGANTGISSTSITHRVFTKVPMTSHTPSFNATRASADWAAIVVSLPAMPVVGEVKVWSGTAWSPAIPKIYNGTSWDPAVAKVSNGTAWTPTSS